MIETIRSIPTALFLMITFFPVVLTAVLIGAGLKARRRAAIISATPTAHIGMAQDGYREFEGRTEAIGGRTVAAPLTKWPCVWYHAKVEEFSKGRGSGRSSSWTTVKELTSDAPFFVRDATGVCSVEAWGAEVTPTDKSQWYGADQTPADRNPAKVGPTESLTPLMEIAGGPNSRFRYFEERIYDGDPLLALGHFSTGRMADGFDAAGDEDDEEDDADSDLPAGEAGAADDLTDEDREEIAAAQLADALRETAAEITKASIGRGDGKQPFILTTTLQAVEVAQSSMGAQGLLTGAAMPAAITLFLIWARFF